MDSVAREVLAWLEDDAALRSCWQRGFVNRRGLARWLVENKFVAGTETAVSTVLARAQPVVDQMEERFKAARRVLAGAHVNTRSHMVMATLAKTDPALKGMARLCEAVDPAAGESLRVVHSHTKICVVLEDRSLALLRNSFQGQKVEFTQGLAELEVIAPESVARTPGVVAMLSNALANRGVNVLESFTSTPEHIYLVKEDAALPGYRALDTLIRNCREEVGA